MTRPVLRAAGALLCLATLPAFAAGQASAIPPGAVTVLPPPARGAAPAVKPRPVPKPPSPTAMALNAAIKEAVARRSPNTTFSAWIATLPGFHFTPATSKLLIRQLGTDKLFSVKRQAGAGGSVDYLFAVPALRHTDPDGGTFSWETMQGKVNVAQDGITIANQFEAPRVAMEDKTMRFEARAISMSGTSLDTGFGYGDATADIGNIQVLSKSDGTAVSMDGLFAKFGISDQGATVGVSYETGMRTVTAAGERVDDLHLALHFNGLDKAAVEQLGKLGKEMKAQEAQLAKLPPAAMQEQLIKPFLRQMGAAVTAKGAAIELDDLSFSYRGHKASMRGQLHLENVTPADLDQPAVLIKKVAGHVDVQVPLAMLRAFSETIVRKQLAKAQPGADAATIEKASVQGYETALRQAVSSGYAKVEGDMLVTSIDIRDGNVTINGKPFEMPKPPAPVAAVDSATGVMRARRIADKCTLPDFPPEVVAQDSTLTMALRLTVNADGSVSNVALARSSGWPDYDKAVLSAATRCTYIPALKNGKPVAVPTTWEVVRAPGSVRP